MEKNQEGKLQQSPPLGLHLQLCFYQEIARLLKGFFKSSNMYKHQFCNSKIFFSFLFFGFMSRSYKLYHYLLKHCFTLCGFSVFLSNQTRIKYLYREKVLPKIVLPLYMTVFQSIVTCPRVVFNKCIMMVFIFLFQEIVLLFILIHVVFCYQCRNLENVL